MEETIKIITTAKNTQYFNRRIDFLFAFPLGLLSQINENPIRDKCDFSNFRLTYVLVSRNFKC